MESNEARDALREADRAAAAPWIDFPPTPWWYVPGVALFAAAMPPVYSLLDGWQRSLAQLGLVAVVLAFLLWYRRYRGTMPSGSAPRELRGALWAFIAGAIVLTLSVWLVAETAGPWWAAALSGIGALVVVGWYERAYTRAADRIRERVG